MHYRSPNTKAGLTLIEMMLVVVIIAVATLSSIKILKNRTTTNVINTVAAQMQNVGQGVVAYYMVNNKWPPPGDLSSLSYNPQNQGETFFSPQALCTPFPSSNYSSFCKNFAEIEGSSVANANYYNIQLVTDNASSALAIASKLPNSTATGNMVSMPVTPPAQYVNANGGFTSPNQGWIVSAGLISTTTEYGKTDTQHNYVAATPVILPNCGNGFEGHVIFAPQHYQVADNWGLHVIVSDPKDQNKKDKNGNEIYAAQLTDNPDGASPSGGGIEHLVYYITFCLPAGHWGSNFIDNTWLQDGQCSTSWLKFLQMTNPNFSVCNSTSPSTGTKSSDYSPGTWKTPTPIVGSPLAY